MLLDPLLRHAAERPDATAMTDDRGSLTYAQLAATAAGLARVIAVVNRCKPRVGVLLPACTSFAACFYGALLAGKSIAPINFLLSPQQVAHQVVDSGVDVILTAPPLAEKFAQLPAKLIDLAALPTPAEPPRVPTTAPDVAAGDEAIPVVHERHERAAQGRAADARKPRDVRRGVHRSRLSRHRPPLPGPRAAVPLHRPDGHAAGAGPPGARPSITWRGSARWRRWRRSATRGATSSWRVPSMYGAMLSLKNASPDDFAHVYALLCGGEPASTALRESFQARFGKPLYQGYGLSETCGPIAVNAPHAARAGSVGQLVPGGTARVVDESGNVLSACDTGEIQLGGPTIMHGYLGLSDATRDALTDDGYFRTGDLGHLDSDGYLFITGRAKDMIIVGGEKLAPIEIEDLLLRHPSIAEAAVVARRDEGRGEVPVAFVVAREGHGVDLDAVRAHLKPFDLPGWKIPKNVHVVDTLPRSPTGKVLKRELSERANG